MTWRLRVCAIALFASAIAVPGCSWFAEPVASDGNETSHKEACVRLLRDLRLYCKEGLRDKRAAVRMDCMSRRLELEKQCI